MLQHLDATPVQGVDLSNVRVLRLDKTGGVAPGNKSFKLEHLLARAADRGCQRIVSFGGPWSNHLHALAAVGQEQGIETVGLVRGDASVDTAMLRDARRWGMRIVHLGYGDYRRRNDSDFQQELVQCFGPCLLVPEGGASEEGAAGCAAIAHMIRSEAPDGGRVVMAVGTGTTLAGVAAALGPQFVVTGISALKGAADLEARVAELIEHCDGAADTPWHILHDYHCGGFAQVNDVLKGFMLAFEKAHGVPLEPVYSGKMLYAVYCQIREGTWSVGEPLIAVHMGGLQGRRGYPWLPPIAESGTDSRDPAYAAAPGLSSRVAG